MVEVSTFSKSALAGDGDGSKTEIILGKNRALFDNKEACANQGLPVTHTEAHIKKLRGALWISMGMGLPPARWPAPADREEAVLSESSMNL